MAISAQYLAKCSSLRQLTSKKHEGELTIFREAAVKFTY